MSSLDVTDETTVNDSHSVTVPSGIRDRLDIERGDKLRWTLTDDETHRVEVVRQRYGAFEDREPIDVGEESERVGGRFDDVTRLTTADEPFGGG